ncbi:cell envelope integrity protein CreD [Sphingomonas jaspsi]|uniref:cell envelope integrity protein CreD n=1 Tax=Sphingomonas jaspsi TaxID=392409 RepID=UPI0004AFFA3D|nr:cell envelope integrity protein CreD [Sphingomonas jaspsi]
MFTLQPTRSPGKKLLFAILTALALAVPLFMVWFLIYDREEQSQTAVASIAQGWGGKQVLRGPVLVIPYKSTTQETAVENGKSVTRVRTLEKELALDPAAVDLSTTIDPKPLKRSIYEAVVYDSAVRGAVRFALPTDLARYGVDRASLDLSKAELRFAIADQRGLGANPSVRFGGRPVSLQPGAHGSGGGFFAFVDAGALAGKSIVAEFDYRLRGNASLALEPRGGDIHWRVASSWPHPSFTGSFLPGARTIGADGFKADYRIGNLSLGRTLVDTAERGQWSFESGAAAAAAEAVAAAASDEAGTNTVSPAGATASVELIQPVDLYSRVDRAAKYGFLFIGFTFMALLMFDIIGGIRVSSVEYLLMGAALLLFFVLLLAFAEVIGFALAYLVAASAIVGLNTAYSAAVLGSWKRGYVMGGLLGGLYAVLYILLGLEALSLLIGSVLLFVTLAGVMYATRRIDWSGGEAAAHA